MAAVKAVSRPATKVAATEKEKKDLILATRRGLSVLRGIEKLGGISGYQKWLATPQPATLSPNILQTKGGVALQDSPNTTAVAGDFWAALVYEGVELVTSDGHTGEGYAWGVGVGYMDGLGVLTYTDWDTLLSKENDFYIAGGAEEAGGITIFFLVDGNLVANATLAGDGLVGAIGIDGTFNWKSS
ncbi:MAG: hypothetical protein M1831_005368 [Alyxoria varia]|nr:MAG: hypothetical protein M1831_005368 [Alyxoria varia]